MHSGRCSLAAFGTIMNIIRIRSIKRLRAIKKGLSESFGVECVDGRAKWIPSTRILSIKVHLIEDDSSGEAFLDFVRNSQGFNLEVAADSREDSTTFKVITVDEIEWRSGTVRPQGPFSINYYMKFCAEHVSSLDSQNRAAL